MQSNIKTVSDKRETKTRRKVAKANTKGMLVGILLSVCLVKSLKTKWTWFITTEKEEPCYQQKQK